MLETYKVSFKLSSGPNDDRSQGLLSSWWLQCPASLWADQQKLPASFEVEPVHSLLQFLRLRGVHRVRARRVLSRDPVLHDQLLHRVYGVLNTVQARGAPPPGDPWHPSRCLLFTSGASVRGVSAHVQDKPVVVPRGPAGDPLDVFPGPQRGPPQESPPSAKFSDSRFRVRRRSSLGSFWSWASVPSDW